MSVDELCFMKKDANTGWNPANSDARLKRCAHCGWVCSVNWSGMVQSDPEDPSMGIWFCSTDHWVKAKSGCTAPTCPKDTTETKTQQEPPSLSVIKKKLKAREDWEELVVLYPDLPVAMEDSRKKSHAKLIRDVWVQLSGS